MYNFGLKLWSINENYANLIRSIYEKEPFGFIELYALPDTYNDYIHIWSELKTLIPFKIHAPHFMHGVNFSIADKYNQNLKLIEDSFRFADKLDADTIIFHPGIAGDYRESAKQISSIKDSRAVIENKPYNLNIAPNSSLKKTDTCVGAKYEEIEYILANSSFGFCLDIGHLIAAANGLNLDIYTELKRFNTLKPRLYHLSDGDMNSDIDSHYHISTGNYDFHKIFTILDKNIPITIESEKNSTDSLDDFIEDLRELKKISI